MSDDPYASREIVRVPGFGRYVWEPALQIVDFIETGCRRSSETLFLNERENTLGGALRKVGRAMAKSFYGDTL